MINTAAMEGYNLLKMNSRKGRGITDILSTKNNWGVYFFSFATGNINSCVSLGGSVI